MSDPHVFLNVDPEEYADALRRAEEREARELEDEEREARDWLWSVERPEI